MKHLRYLLFLVPVMGCFVAPLPAADFIWTGNGGDNWTNAGSWSPNGVPGNTDKATINSGSTMVSTAVTVQQLELNGGTLTVNSNLNVDGVFNWTAGTLNGSGGTTAIAGAATLDLPGNGSRNLGSGHRLLNTTNGLIRADNAVTGQRSISGAGLLENHGTILADTNVILLFSTDLLQRAGVIRGDGEVRFQSGSLEPV